MPLFKRNFRRSSSLSFPNTKSIISLLRSPYNYSRVFFWRGHSPGSKNNLYLLTEEEEENTNQSLPLFVPHNIKQTSQRKTRKFEKLSNSFFFLFVSNWSSEQQFCAAPFPCALNGSLWDWSWEGPSFSFSFFFRDLALPHFVSKEKGGKKMHRVADIRKFKW